MDLRLRLNKKHGRLRRTTLEECLRDGRIKADPKLKTMPVRIVTTSEAIADIEKTKRTEHKLLSDKTS